MGLWRKIVDQLTLEPMVHPPAAVRAVHPPATVEVSFFDSESGQMFARFDMPPEHLPSSFEAQTVMHLKDGNWIVERAEPMTAAEFVKTGKLRLILSKSIELNVGWEDILLSLPTISDESPAIAPGTTKLGKDVLELHEDDWRQREFISETYGQEVEATFGAIRKIYTTARRGNGFTKLHLRKEIPEPLERSNIPFSELQEALGQKAVWLDGIAEQKYAGTVVEGFAVRLLSGIEIYGVSSGGIIRFLCLQNIRQNNVEHVELIGLRDFASRHKLCLVDWCAALQVDPSEPAFLEYFRASQV